MKRELTVGALLLLALGLVAGGIRALDLLGAETLRLLALVLAVPGGVALMALGLTPLVRAWRVPAVLPPERHVIRETKLHTIDARRGPDPLPAAPTPNLYPALQSSEWRAGLLPDARSQTGPTYWRVSVPEEEGEAGWEDRPR